MSVAWTDEIRREHWRIWKNVFVLSTSFMCLFTAFGLVSNLQSTIHSEAGLGNTSQAVMFAVQIFSSMFAPTVTIKKLKLKWTMILTQLGSTTYIAAQFYPCYATFIPAAIIVGFSSAPMWSAQSTYLTKMGMQYVALPGSEHSHETGLSRTFGIAFMITQSSTIWGNLIGSLVLSADHANTTIVDNSSIIEYHCGSSFCFDWNTNTSLDDHENDFDQPSNVPMLMGILLAISLMATLIIIVFIDEPPPVINRKQSDGTFIAMKGDHAKHSSMKMLMATFRLMKNPNMQLLIPLSLWTGFEKAFWLSDFTFAFITCSWGVDKIGYVLMCFGTSAAATSLVFGHLVGRIGRVPFFVLAATVTFSILVFMEFFWHPEDHSHPETFFIVAALWGMAHSIVNTALNTLYGVLFACSKEAAFSNFRLWKSLGLAIALAYSTFLCVRTKVYILMVLLVVAMVSYFAIEVREWKQRMGRKKALNRRTTIGVLGDEEWTFTRAVPACESSRDPG